MNPMLTAAQVGEMIGMDRKTIIRRALAGELAYHDFGDAYRFELSDVEQWIKDRRVEPAKKKTPLAGGTNKGAK